VDSSHPKERHPRAPKPAEPRAPLKFRIVDVLSRSVLADDAGAREAVDVLNGVRSIVDVQVYIREREQWRLLTLDELRTLWGARTRQPAQAG
jgi:hypothetical protein